MEEYAINLDHISFSYENKLVINDVSLKVKRGEHIAIIGDSGCGKSTLLKLIAGLYVPDKGMVTVDGEVLSEAVRKKVAAVMQHNGLFPFSIRDNITCGHDVPEEMLIKACKEASLWDWIEELELGLETNVGERGGNVSGGQAQRIQIARAICKNAPVILLDEPISALDKETGISVMQALSNLSCGKSVVYVTHQTETLNENYTVYRMEGGGLRRA